MSIDGKTQLVGVIGHPIAHTLSPAMHNAAFEALGLNWGYVPLPVSPERLPDAIRGLAALGFRGVNVTVPHKVAVMPLLDLVSDEAQIIGAVNTISVDSDTGRLSGTNTDLQGFMADLWAHGITVNGSTRALLLGAGGAARAVGSGLARHGAQVVIVNRTPERGAELAVLLSGKFPGARVESLPHERLAAAADGSTLIVNATSLGMHPYTDSTPWADGVPFPVGAVVYDTVYRPQRTRLIQDAERAGLRAIGGIGMLARQGAAAFEMWTQRPAPIEVMVQTCLGQLAIG